MNHKNLNHMIFFAYSQVLLLKYYGAKNRTICLGFDSETECALDAYLALGARSTCYTPQDHDNAPRKQESRVLW